MCKQMDSIQAVTMASRELGTVLEKILTKREQQTTSNGTVRAIRQAWYASPNVPTDMKDTLGRIK